MSQQCLQTVYVVQTWLFTVSFYFPFFWITKWRKLAHHKRRFSRKEGTVFWDTFPRGVRIFYKKQHSRRARFIIFLQILAIIINTKIVIKIQVSSFGQSAPGCRFSIFVATLDFSRQMLKIWSGPTSRERLHIQIWYGPNCIGPWSLHMSRSHSKSGPNFWHQRVQFT